MKLRIFDIIKEARKAGINISSVAMDMGGTNQALQNALGIRAKRGRPISNTFKVDPSDEQEIAIFPDCSHLLKNMRNGLLKHDFVISKEIQKKYNLPTNIISRHHIYYLKDYQDKNTWKITPKLTNACFFMHIAFL